METSVLSTESWGRQCRWPSAEATWREHMKDLVYVTLTLAFFVVSWLYVKGLERL